MNADQPRTPAGSPEGGQFSATSGSESELALPGVSPPIRDGLFDVDILPMDMTNEELAAVTDPSAPLRVRVLAAAAPYAGIASRSASDPHPLVRAIAATHWQITEVDLERLTNDPATVRALEVIVGSGLLGEHPKEPSFT